MMKAPEPSPMASKMPESQAATDVRVSCLISSAVVGHGLAEEKEQQNDVFSAPPRNDTGDKDEGPPSVIETFSKSEMSPLVKCESSRKGDAHSDKQQDKESGKEGSVNSDEEDGDDSTSEYEGEEIEVMVDMSDDDTLSTNHSESGYVAGSSRVAAKRLTATLSGQNPKSTSHGGSQESIMSILNGLLFVALLPVCSYVLKEATLVTRDVSLSLNDQGLIASRTLVQFMVSLNIAFGVAVFLGVMVVFFDPSRLGRFVASLEPRLTTPSV